MLIWRSGINQALLLVERLLLIGPPGCRAYFPHLHFQNHHTAAVPSISSKGSPLLLVNICCKVANISPARPAEKFKIQRQMKISALCSNICSLPRKLVHLCKCENIYKEFSLPLKSKIIQIFSNAKTVTRKNFLSFNDDHQKTSYESLLILSWWFLWMSSWMKALYLPERADISLLILNESDALIFDSNILKDQISFPVIVRSI